MEKRRTFILSDTIQKAYFGWMHDDLTTSHNLAHLAIWRARNHRLWLHEDEECFLKVAMENPPDGLESVPGERR